MENQQLITSEEQRDLGITITRDLKWQKQTEKSCKTANRVLGFIARNSSSGHHIYEETDKMERVQRRATKMTPEIRNHSYQQWLKDLKLISLIQRRLRGQLIEVFKYLNRFNNVSPLGLFDYDFNDKTQNNGKKLMVKQFNTSVAQHFSP